MRRPFLTVAMLASAAALPACAGSGAAKPVANATSRFSDTITRAEIDAQHYSTAYELVAAVRPNWLHGRGPESLDGPPAVVQIHLNGARMGGVEVLRQITLDAVQSLQFYDAVTAMGRWGLGYKKGAIELKTAGGN